MRRDDAERADAPSAPLRGRAGEGGVAPTFGSETAFDPKQFTARAPLRKARHPAPGTRIETRTGSDRREQTGAAVR